MALSKVTYVDNQTVIGAKNLNDIQDEIIANAPKIHTLTALTAAAMPDYAAASKPTTLIKYGENTYAYAGENGDGVGSWEIRYLSVTGSSAAGTEVYANWLILQYMPTTYAAVAVRYESGYIGAKAVTPSGATASATSGTLTNGEYSALTLNNSNYILFNNECYYLADKQHTAGMLTYVHTGYNGGDGVTKYFNITASTRAWTLTSTTAGGTIDTSLSTTSTNAVQNKVVTAALNGKQGTLTAGNGIKIENNIISAELTDYELQAIIDGVIAELSQVVVTVSEDKTITLYGELEPDTYIIAYKNIDGTINKVGTITIGEPVAAYTNILSTCIAPDTIATTKDIWESVGYKNGAYLSTAVPYWGADATKAASGAFMMQRTDAIYFSGANLFDGSNHTRIVFFNKLNGSTIGALTSPFTDSLSVTQLPNGAFKIDANAWLLERGYNDAYMALCAQTPADNWIITINEEI